jgi:hypothetical protein
MSIHVHIDRLVLDGLALSPHDRPAIHDAVSRELARLIEPGKLSPASGVTLARVAVPAIALTANATAPEIGRQIAGAIASGIHSGAIGDSQTTELRQNVGGTE